MNFKATDLGARHLTHMTTYEDFGWGGEEIKKIKGRRGWCGDASLFSPSAGHVGSDHRNDILSYCPNVVGVCIGVGERLPSGTLTCIALGNNG